MESHLKESIKCLSNVGARRQVIDLSPSSLTSVHQNLRLFLMKCLVVANLLDVILFSFANLSGMIKFNHPVEDDSAELVSTVDRLF